MNNWKNYLKLGLAVLLVALLVVVAFAVGYRAGNETERNTVEDVGERTTSSLVQPTATIVSPPVALPTDAALPTGTALSTSSQAQDTPAPNDISPSPTASTELTSTNNPERVEPPEEAALSDEEALQVLHQVWDLIDEEFFGELPTPEERAYGAIRGMLGTLDDDYTSFSEPAIAEIRRADASGSFEGIGAFVTMNEEDILSIVQTFRGSPAEKAGLLPGDLVLEVDGKSIVGYGIYEAITLIRGPEGTEVELTIQRGEAEPFKASIVRARLDIPVLESRMLESSIGYVSLFDFSSQATSRLEKAIEELIDQGATALIFDLRGNPGGFLDQAVQVSDLFLPEGLVLTERRSDGQELEFTSSNDGPGQDIPLVVLVNGGSASASEIVAGAVQDRGRGILIGEATFGKGSVQLLHTLSDGSELRVTVARWYTPNGNAIHGDGLAPDIEVLMTPEDLDADRDPQLERAIEYLKTGQ
jgi:carboxyl-terminal processing protease